MNGDFLDDCLKISSLNNSRFASSEERYRTTLSLQQLPFLEATSFIISRSLEKKEQKKEGKKLKRD